MDAPLTMEEVHTAVFAMKDNKAPGTDGLPIEFYKMFWNELKDKLMLLYSFSITNGRLNKTARQGLICLLPKGQKDPSYLKNWRPLTLLNLDYKILAKTLATRIKHFLPSIIGEQQTGFLEGRQITDNIVKTLDILAFANAKKKKQVIITIDFEKCFDRVAYDAIYGSLKYFKIGDKFLQMIRLFFTDFTVCTQNAGYCSQLFIKGRSVNQGCNISPYLFLLCSESMSHKIFENSQIQGVTVGDIKYLMAQFADDTVLFVNFDLDILNQIVDTFDVIETNTGLKINYDKTTIY